MSKIQWTDKTWNPVTGCSKVSAGCQNCYAERMAKRLQAMGNKKYFSGFLPTMHKDSLEIPYNWKKSRMIFVCSMSDLFHEDVLYEFISSVWDTMFDCGAVTPRHIFQVLTKRPKRMLAFTKAMNNEGRRTDYNNVWLGVTAENQAMADERIPLLLQTPAAVRFVSFEPLLEHVEPLIIGCPECGKPPRDVIAPTYTFCQHCHNEIKTSNCGLIDWVIIGCESGASRRPCKLEWVRGLVDQCRNAQIPVFVKQLDIDGKVVKDWDDPLFPEDLKIRELPKG